MSCETVHRAVLIASVAGLLFIAPQAHSQAWSTANFDTNAGFVRGFSLAATNQPIAVRWNGNDPYNTNTSPATGETDVLQFALGYTPSPLANNSLIQGGSDIANSVFPGTNNVRLWKTFTPLSSPTVTFFAEWSIIPPLLPSPYNFKDTFSFDLRNAANTQSLLELQFNPNLALTNTRYTLQTIASGSPNDILIDLGYQAVFQVIVDITGAEYDLTLNQINASTRTNIVSYNLVSGGSLASGTTAADFGTVSIDWDLASGNPSEPGSNYIIVNEVSVVPEPRTYALLALSVVALYATVSRRRRRL